MRDLRDEVRRLRERQDEDFRLIMLGLATTRDAITESFGRLEANFQQYCRDNGEVLDALQEAVFRDHEDRFASLERRVEALESRIPPAA